MLKSSIRGIMGPPPILAQPATISPLNPATLVTEALQQSLYLSIPSSAATTDTAATSSSSTITRMKHLCIHPSLPHVVYELDPQQSPHQAEPNKPLSPQRQLIVQNYMTRQVLFKLSLGDLAGMMFYFDLTAPNGIAKQTAALRSLGSVQRIAFFDSATLHATSMVYQYGTNGATRWQYLLVQLTSRVVVLNMRQGPLSQCLDLEQRLRVPTVARFPPFRPFVLSMSEQSLKSMPTSNALPLTPSLLLIGCADGNLRVYDWVEERVVRLPAQKPSSKEAIIQLVAVNAYNTDIGNTLDQHNNSNSDDADHDKQIKRILSVGKKGSSYIWEIVFSEETLIDIRLPLAKLEGQFTVILTKDGKEPSAEKTVVDNNNAVFDHKLIDFDAHRELLFWLIPTGYKLSTKPHVLVWDLKLTANLKRKGKNVIPKQDPWILSFPTIEQPVTFLMGWMHPAFPETAITCALVTQGGEVHVQCASMEEFNTSKVVKAVPLFSTLLPSLIANDAGTIGPPIVKVFSVHTARRLDTTSLLVGSNLGLIHMRLHESGFGPKHAHFGAGLGSEWGKSCLVVDHSAILWAPLDLTNTNPLGKVGLRKAMQVYQSPPAPHLPPEIQKRAIRLPPRFFPSPSGNFLCLYWPDEMRYEILHLASILRKNEGVYTVAVATGNDILSFAWVGDDDVFALLHPPAERKGDSSNTVITEGTNLSGGSSVGSAGIKAFRKPFLRKTGGGMDKTVASAPPLRAEINNDSSRFMPTVELKHLIASVLDSTQYGGSIAAATALGLGEITLRGGNRNPPTLLFGGPVLCVASEGTKANDGGAAYFYTRKLNTEDNKASGYVSSGPTLPNPEFVEWDDDGRLCAVVVHGLVAVYLSKEPEFTLLGNVPLGTPTEREITVTGVKFVHGVLYCTTKTSVQCVFMGNVEEGICQLDSFMLASADAPSLLHQSFSLTPRTLPMTLNHPVVLGYQSGSLLVSTVNGIFGIPLDHPLLRIGSLMAAGMHAKAQQWFEAIPESSHESLAAFLDRRGAPDLAVTLPGLSIESAVDLSLRNGLTGHLVELVQKYGVDALQKVDFGRGTTFGILGPEVHHHSLTVCVGAYLLSAGKANLVKIMAADCLKYGDEGSKQAFILASLLMAVDAEGAKPIVHGAVGEKREDQDPMEGLEQDVPIDTVLTCEYPVTAMVRDYIL